MVNLVVLCAEKPTTALLKKVASELPIQLKKVSDDQNYKVTMAPVEGAVMVTDGTITVKVCLTSPLLREQGNLEIIAVYILKKNLSRFRVTSFSFFFFFHINFFQIHTFFSLHFYFL